MMVLTTSHRNICRAELRRGRHRVFSVMLVVLLAGQAAAQSFGAKDRAVVDVRSFGAKGDGNADDTEALQRAVDGGQRTVVIPAGNYVIRAALRLDSHTTIRAATDATIRLADSAGTSVDTYLVSNRDSAAGNTNLVIEGGIWDGNNQHNPRGDPAKMPCYTGVAMHFNNVRGLVLRNLVLRNPESFAIRAIHLYGFRIEDIGFDFSVTRPNQDGVHLNGFCERGVIRNLTALSPYATNDDMVALNADDGDPATYVFMQGMVNGPIRDIRIENLQAPSVFSFVRILSDKHPVENVMIDGITGGARFYVINMDRWRFPRGGGKISNVTIRNLHVHKMADNFSSQARAAERPLVHIQTAVQNFRIEEFAREAVEQPAAVTLLLDNGRRNRVRLAGITSAQREALLAASPAVSLHQFHLQSEGPMQDLALETDATVTLPSGGFTLLALDTLLPREDQR
jgi:hypothetical protein